MHQNWNEGEVGASELPENSRVGIARVAMVARVWVSGPNPNSSTAFCKQLLIRRARCPALLASK
ncbi:uncharacterized protein PG986_007092 [Apiospora aurea]|uniref:Uncharacterized protein n=1 Tax=Apiospora aurea TaxID=335848 RepID=A0ABR1QBM0_9PEZI